MKHKHIPCCPIDWTPHMFTHDDIKRFPLVYFMGMPYNRKGEKNSITLFGDKFKNALNSSIPEYFSDKDMLRVTDDEILIFNEVFRRKYLHYLVNDDYFVTCRLEPYQEEVVTRHLRSFEFFSPISINVVNLNALGDGYYSYSVDFSEWSYSVNISDGEEFRTDYKVVNSGNTPVSISQNKYKLFALVNAKTYEVRYLPTELENEWITAWSVEINIEEHHGREVSVSLDFDYSKENAYLYEMLFKPDNTTYFLKDNAYLSRYYKTFDIGIVPKDASSGSNGKITIDGVDYGDISNIEYNTLHFDGSTGALQADDLDFDAFLYYDTYTRTAVWKRNVISAQDLYGYGGSYGRYVPIGHFTAPDKSLRPVEYNTFIPQEVGLLASEPNEPPTENLLTSAKTSISIMNGSTLRDNKIIFVVPREFYNKDIYIGFGEYDEATTKSFFGMWGKLKSPEISVDSIGTQEITAGLVIEYNTEQKYFEFIITGNWGVNPSYPFTYIKKDYQGKDVLFTRVLLCTFKARILNNSLYIDEYASNTEIELQFLSANEYETADFIFGQRFFYTGYDYIFGEENKNILSYPDNSPLAIYSNTGSYFTYDTSYVTSDAPATSNTNISKGFEGSYSWETSEFITKYREVCQFEPFKEETLNVLEDVAASLARLKSNEWLAMKSASISYYKHLANNGIENRNEGIEEKYDNARTYIPNLVYDEKTAENGTPKRTTVESGSPSSTRDEKGNYNNNPVVETGSTDTRGRSPNNTWADISQNANAPFINQEKTVHSIQHNKTTESGDDSRKTIITDTLDRQIVQTDNLDKSINKKTTESGDSKTTDDRSRNVVKTLVENAWENIESLWHLPEYEWITKMLEDIAFVILIQTYAF